VAAGPPRRSRRRDIPGLVRILSGDEASYVTGPNIVVDGGWSAALPGAGYKINPKNWAIYSISRSALAVPLT